MKLRATILMIVFLGAICSLFAQEDLQRPGREQFRKAEMKRHAAAVQQLLRTPTPNQRRFDINSYTLNIRIWPLTESIDGSTVISGTALEGGLDHLEIDLYSNLTVDSVLQNGQAASFTRVGNLVSVQLESVLGVAETFTIEIFYRGNPQSVGLGSWRWSTHQGTPIIATLSEPFGAPTWWACKDDPADKADSVFLNIEVPDNLVVAANGLLQGITPALANRHVYHWETHYPISTYLVSLAITNYAEFNDWYVTAGGDSMELVYYVYPEHLAAAQEDFSVTDEMMAAFAPLFGEYPFLAEKYGMAIFTWGGAMEHQTMTSYGAGLITGNHYYDWINAHELAHQWFGDMISPQRWSHIWLNEGFASYGEALWQEEAYGEQAYHNYMQIQYQPSFTGSLFVYDSTNVGALFSNTVYDKGSWVLHMLRGVLGDSLFFACLDAYATDPTLMYGNALTEDLQEICESVSGRDLSWFFEQWVYRGGRPVYEYNWSVESTTAPYLTRLAIRQTNAIPFTMPLQIELTLPAGDTTFLVWDSLAFQEFYLETDQPPLDLALDPDNWVLKRSTFVVGISRDDQAVPYHLELAQNYPNPFNPATTIRFGLPEPGPVTVEIYNALGQRIFTANPGRLSSGYHQFRWDGRTSAGNPVASGVYVYRVIASGDAAMRKMILLR